MSDQPESSPEGTPSARLRALGLSLPEPPKAVAAYIPAVRDGHLIWTSGQLPFRAGAVLHPGLVGEAVSVEAGQEAARQAALNALAVAAALAGGLDRLEGVLKLVGFVQCRAGFGGQPQVVNGASELLQAVFGESGRHARSAVGVSALPLNAPVEVEVIFRLGAA